MIQGLGASIFVHNAIEYDYCLRESIESVVPICEEIVILDAQSNDGTIEYIKQIVHDFPNVTAYFGARWECANNFMRLQLIHLGKIIMELIQKNLEGSDIIRSIYARANLLEGF